MGTRTHALPLVLLGALGCTEPIKSDEVATSEMVAALDVTCDGNTSVATALFTYGSGFPVTYVQLTPEDTLTVSAAELSKEMGELVIDDLISYVASFDLIDADTAFTVSLERTLDGGAPASTVTLPPPFTLTSPTDELSFSRGTQDLLVSWEGEGNAEDALTLVIDGDCIESYEELLDADDGEATIPAGTLISVAGSETETCDVTVWLKRQRSGELDPGYAGGSITAKQYRTVEVASAP